MHATVSKHKKNKTTEHVWSRAKSRICKTDIPEAKSKCQFEGDAEVFVNTVGTSRVNSANLNFAELLLSAMSVQTHDARQELHRWLPTSHPSFCFHFPKMCDDLPQTTFAVLLFFVGVCFFTFVVWFFTHV